MKRIPIFLARVFQNRNKMLKSIKIGDYVSDVTQQRENEIRGRKNLT